MTEPSFYYTVNESLIYGNADKLVSYTQFRAMGSSLNECKRDAEQFYKNRKERVNYWMMLGTYEIASHQTFELNICLVEIATEIPKLYLIKSINKEIPQSYLEYEKMILAKYPANVNNWRDNNHPREETEEQKRSTTTVETPTPVLHTGGAKKGLRNRIRKVGRRLRERPND